MKQNPFFNKVEDDVYRLLTFEENLKEHRRPNSYNKHELEYFQERFILGLEEELVEAKDIINRGEGNFEAYHRLVEYLEDLLNEFYIIEGKNL